MADAPGKTSSKIAAIVVLIPVLILGWYIAPLFLPMWRWQQLSFEDLSRKTGVPLIELTREYDAVIRYAPRGDGDPIAWQLVTLSPAWTPVDEDRLLVRATVVSDRSGTPPSNFLIGSGHRRDIYFNVRCWRLPPGSLGFNAHRPVIVYKGQSLEKLSINDAEMTNGQIRDGKWENDDQEVDDGFHLPELEPQ